MPNPFDKFDASAGASPAAAVSNPFDQFDVIAGNAAMAGDAGVPDFGNDRPAPVAGMQRLPEGEFFMGGSEVPRLTSSGGLAPTPTNQNVQALQFSNAHAAPGQILGTAADFDAQFGQGASAQYAQANTAPAPPSNWLQEQLGATNDQGYGEGAGYLVDNPLTRGLGNAAASTDAGLAYLAGKGADALGLDSVKRFTQGVIADDLAKQQALAAPRDAGVGSLITQGAANLGGQLAIGGMTGGQGAAAQGAARVGLMDAAKAALASPATRMAGTLGVTQAGNEAARMEAEGHPVSGSQFGTMALTDTAANLVPLAGRWNIPARVASGAVVGEATNEASNVAAGRPLGTGALVATSLGGALGLLPGHHNLTLADEGRALAQQVMFGNRVDFLRDATARQDLDERIEAAAQQNGGMVHPDLAAQLADQVANEHGTSVDALVQAPRNPMEAGSAAADQMLADMQQTLAAPVVKPAPAAVAPNASLTDATSLIDQRLSALDDLAGQAKPPAELRQLGNDAGSLEDLLRGEYAKRQEGVVRSPENSLTDDELAQAEQHFAAVRSELEKHRQAVAAGNEAKRLRDRLAKVDNDAELLQLVNRHIAPIADGVRSDAAAASRAEPPATAQSEPPLPQAPAINPFDRFDAAAPVESPASQPDALAAAAPREPALPQLLDNTSRDDLVQRWRDARTDGEKAVAAAHIAAFDRQAPPQTLEAAAPKFSRDTAPAGNTDLLTEGFKTLAENPELFRNQLLPGKTPSELAKQAGGTGYSGVAFHDGVPAHEFVVDQGEAGKAKAFMYDDGNGVWIDVSQLQSGGGAGEKIYNLAFSYAKNNGKNFIEDPAGLSDSAMYRRPVQQTAAMLKAGSADNIGFDPDGTGFLQTRRPGGPDTRPIKYDAGRRLDPTLREHLLTVYNNTVKAVPEIEHYAYDPASGNFVDRRTGAAVGDDVFKRLSGDRRVEPIREAMVRVGDSEDGSRLAPAPVGGNSLKTAALAGTLLRAKPHEAPALLGALRDVSTSSDGLGVLEKILPSKYNEAPADAGVSVSGGDTAGSGDVRQSQAADQADAHTKFTADQVRDSARKAWGNRFITKLERGGVLHMITADEAVARGLAKSTDELAGVKGLYADGKAYVLTDQVRDLADVPGIVVHEAGLHYGYDRLTKPEERQALRNRVNRALAAGDADIVKAWQHAEKVGTPAKALHEEAMAYLVENAPGHDVVTRVVDAVKRGLNRAGVPVDMLESNSDAIKRAARDMLRRAANPEAHSGSMRIDADGAQPWRASTIEGVPVFSRDEAKAGGSVDEQASNQDVHYSRATPPQVRQQAAIIRQSVLSQLAAQGYGQGALGWTGNPNEYGGWRGGVQKALAALSDKMDPVKRAEQAIEGATGRSIADDADAYRLENLMHGRAADRLDALDRTAVKPLMKSMKQQGIAPKLLMDYLYARHAPERNARIASINKAMPDGGSGLSTQQAQDILAGRADGVYSGQRITPDLLPKLQALAARVDRIRDQTLATLENSGQITPALAASLRNQWQHYIPLRGKEGEADSGPRGAGRGVDIKGKPIKRALGRGDGNTAPPNILAEIVGDAQRAIIQAEKARVGRAVLKLAAEHPNPDVWQVEPVDLEWKFSESTGEAYLAARKPNADKDVLTVVHDGTPYHVRLVDPRIRDAVLNLGAEQATWLVNTLGKFNRWISAVSTRYNPAFTPINAIRDMTMGMTGLMAEHGPRVAADAAKLYLPAMRASWRDARSAPGDASVPNAQKSMDDWAREFAEKGGKTGIVHFNDIEDTTRHLEDSFKSGMELLGDLRPLAAAGKALEQLAPIVHVVEHANDAVENALRLAAYTALRKRGMSADRAAAYAKDLTVNFNRKGQWAGVLNSLYLFYNASAQGVRRGVTLMRNPKVAAFLGSLAALQAAQTAVLMSRHGEDGVSDWDAIPDWKKHRSLLIALPGQGNYFAMPMPYEFGFMTFAGGRITQSALGDDPAKKNNLVNDLGVGLLGSFSPVPLDNGPTGLIPEAIKVPLQLSANRNDFGQRITNEQPYAPYDMPRIAMGKASTAAPYVWLAKAMNRVGGGDDFHPPVIAKGLLDWSPEDLQYLSNTFTGGLGSFVNGSWTSAQKLLAGNYKTGKDGKVDVQWQAMLRDFPIIKAFGWSTDDNRASADRFYDVRDQIERTKAEVQAKLDDGDIRGAQEVAKKAGVFADGMTIKLNADGTPATRLKHTKKGDVRTYQLAAVPGSLFAGYKEASNGLSQRDEATGYSAKVQNGVSDYNRQIQRAYQLPVAERTKAIKELQDQRGGLMGSFLRLYEARKKAVPTPGT
jgi:hypothetical protein